jgi:hypothetical protein
MSRQRIGRTPVSFLESLEQPYSRIRNRQEAEDRRAAWEVQVRLSAPFRTEWCSCRYCLNCDRGNGTHTATGGLIRPASMVRMCAVASRGDCRFQGRRPDTLLVDTHCVPAAWALPELVPAEVSAMSHPGMPRPTLNRLLPSIRKTGRPIHITHGQPPARRSGPVVRAKRLSETSARCVGSRQSHSSDPRPQRWGPWG